MCNFLKKGVVFMRSNIKRVLSTLCVLSSVSGVLTPALVNASSAHEEYSKDFSSAATPAAAASTSAEDTSSYAADIIIPLMRKRNHQKLYDAVVKLEKEGKLSSSSAFMVVVLDQIIKYSTYVVVDDLDPMYGKVEDGDWIFSNSDIREAITNENWEKCEEKMDELFERLHNNYETCGGVWLTEDNDLESRAAIIFLKAFRLYFHKFYSRKTFLDCHDKWTCSKLKGLLEKLNPSNPENLCYGAKVYSDCLDEFSPSDKDGSPVKLRHTTSIILSLLREKDHQKFYDLVIAFMKEKSISRSEAFIYIIFNQMIQNPEYEGIYKYFKQEYYHWFDRLLSCCDRLYELVERCHGVSTSDNSLERRATDVFFKFYKPEYERELFVYRDSTRTMDRLSDERKKIREGLEKALIALNPSNPEGLM